MRSNLVCWQFWECANDALEEWDGQDTADLFVAILRETGEDATVLEIAKQRLAELTKETTP